MMNAMRKCIGALALFLCVMCLANCGVPISISIETDEPVDQDMAVLSEIRGEGFHVTLPENLDAVDGPLAQGEVLHYESDDGSVEVTIVGEKDTATGTIIYSWSPQINSPQGGHEFEYLFRNMDDQEIMFSKDFPGSEIEGGISVVKDEGDGTITFFEIGEPLAHDAKGNPVKCYYRIEGDVLIQGVEPTEDTVYPITIE